MMWTLEQKTFCVETYLKNKSFLNTRRQYLRNFNIDKRKLVEAPSKQLIIVWVKKFRENGNVVKQGFHGRRKTVITPSSFLSKKMLKTDRFLEKGTALDFATVFKLYDEAIQMKSSQKQKKGVETLKKLDKWIQEELGDLAHSRSPAHITRDELVRLMKWKLTRGKFRPRLVELAGSNSEESVKTASKKGIELARKNKVEDAIKALVVLKGIGPATASAILAATHPQKCCFFADEVAHAVPTLATLKYNAAEYELLNTTLVDCSQRLNDELDELIDSDEKENDEAEWTPHKVELAVWTHSFIQLNKPELLSGLKRGTEDSDGSTSKRKKAK